MDKLRAYWLGSGAFLALLAVGGSVAVATGNRVVLGQYMAFDTAHNVLHAALAVFAFAVGLAPVPRVWSARLAMGVGTAYLGLAVLGFLNGDLWGVPARLGVRLHLELGENLVHLAIGVWGAYAGTNE